MPKPANPTPSRSINLHLPADLAMKVSLHLFSELDGRVPQGAYARFFIPLIKQYFAAAHLDLAEWTGAEPGECMVHGDERVIKLLNDILIGYKQ